MAHRHSPGLVQKPCWGSQSFPHIGTWHFAVTNHIHALYSHCLFFLEIVICFSALRRPESKLKIWEHSCWPAAKSGQTLLVNSVLREDHFLLQATFGLRCPPLLEWSCCFFIVSKLFKCRHWKQFFFTLSWGEIAYIWPKEVFLLSFNFRAVYIDLKLKEMIFRITTVSIGPIAGEEEKIWHCHARLSLIFYILSIYSV